MLNVTCVDVDANASTRDELFTILSRGYLWYVARHLHSILSPHDPYGCVKLTHSRS